MSQNNTQGFRLSPQQRNIWSLQQDSKVLSTIAIKGDLRPDSLERTLDEIIGRHEILRTTFQRPPGIKIPFQVVSQESEVSWQFSDLSSLDEEARLSKLEVCFAAERGKPFDFEKGPILRASLFKLSSEDHVLLISLPALCADSKTVANLIDEIGNAYGLSHGGVKVGNEPMQYADFAEWQNELLEGSDEEAEEGKSYWQELASASSSPLALPLEKPPTNKYAFRPKALALCLDSTSVAKVELLAREHETSIQIVLFACWQALIWRLTNQSDFVIFNLSHGRKLEDLQSAIGLYANYLPIACHTEDISFAKHLQGTRDRLSKAEEWQEYFDPNNFSETARDAVAFDFTEQLLAIETDGLTFSLARQEFCLSPFKLKLSCVRSADSIRGELFYDPLCFDSEVVERIAEYFTRFVEQTSAGAPFEISQPAKQRLQTEILAEPMIGTIEIVGEGEARRLLVDFNQTASEFSITKCIHESFAEQAARTPEAIA
ncbi:MAG TPA: condensation domain-containing protein, partial [Pyrinomonadaceae bacterium]